MRAHLIVMGAFMWFTLTGDLLRGLTGGGVSNLPSEPPVIWLAAFIVMGSQALVYALMVGLVQRADERLTKADEDD